MTLQRREVVQSALERSRDADPGQFITIVRFFDQFQAHLLRSVLEEHGIEVVIAGEFTGSVFPRVSLSGPRISGGIQIQVPAARVEEALRLMEELEAGEGEELDYQPTAEEYLEAEGETVEPEEERSVWCPSCGAPGARRIWMRPEDFVILGCALVLTAWIPFWAAVAGVFLVLFKLTQEPRWRCIECGHRWREGGDSLD